MRKTILGIVCAASLTLGMTAASGTASEIESEDRTQDPMLIRGEGSSPRIDPALENDLRAMAELEESSYQTAVAKYSWQNQAAAVAEQLGKTYSEIFASAEINPEGRDGRARFRFTEKPPSEAFDLIAELPVDSEVEFRAHLSENAAEAATTTAHSAFSEIASERATASLGYSPIDQRLSLVFADPSGRLSEDEVRRSVQSALEQNGYRVPDLEVVHDPDSRTGPEVLRGGVRMSSSTDRCTSGFAVNHNTGTTGLITARHCPNNLTYYAEGANRREVILGASFFLARTQGDIQYHRTSEAAGRAFYYAQGSYRQVGERRMPILNTAVCLFGNTTKGTRNGNPTCTNVHSRGHSVEYADGEYHRLTMTNDRVSEGGDSGGPYYFGFTAYGIHSGSRSGPLIHDRSFFTPLINTNQYDTLGSMGTTLRCSSGAC